MVALDPPSSEGGGRRNECPGLTNAPGVYAISDAAEPPILAHEAEHEGVICVAKRVAQAGNPHDHPP